MAEHNEKPAKREWKKEEKALYMPKAVPMVIDVPPMNFFVLEGQGNPGDSRFGDYIEALYAASYTVRMSHKSNQIPEGYYEYTVYPLEGVWDLTEKGKALMGSNTGGGVLNLKDELVFKLMIRQPDFSTPALAEQFLSLAIKKKNNPLIEQIRFETITDGRCIQMLHEGSYDLEPASFAKMEAFCEAQQLTRKEKTHREIYITDARKTAPDKLKTVLRFRID